MMNLNFNTKKIGFFAISGIIVLLIILAFTTKEEENIEVYKYIGIYMYSNTI